MVFRSHPIGACCMLSGQLQGFIPQKMAHFEEHILTLHTARRAPLMPRAVLQGPFPLGRPIWHGQGDSSQQLDNH
jgi:hypothetical protein